MPATGHPSRFFEETAIPALTAAQAFVDPRNIVPVLATPTRVERSVPLKCLVSQINYNVFDMEVGSQQSQFAYMQAKDLTDAVEGLLRTHDVALWNGNDTSLGNPTTPQYYGVCGQINDGGNVATIATTASIVDGLKSTIAQMVANSNYEVRPTAIYSNPVLLDLIDREMKTEFNVVLSSTQVAGGLVVKTLSTQAGELPLIPDWAIPYTGTPGSGSAQLPAYIVSEDMIEYHWLTGRTRASSSSARRARWLADGGGEVRRRGGEGRQLRALQGGRRPLVPHCKIRGDHVATDPCFRCVSMLRFAPLPGRAQTGRYLAT